MKISGAPETEICQKTTGVSRTSKLKANPIVPDAHREIIRASETAVRIPPKKINPRAKRSPPTASPKRISKWCCPQRKLAVFEETLLQNLLLHREMIVQCIRTGQRSLRSKEFHRDHDHEQNQQEHVQ
jgi:hypothetical protein